MERWQDQGIVLAVRRHGENGAIVSLLTETRGRHAGYVRGAQGTRLRGSLEAGNLVDATWQARVDGQLGSLGLELVRSPAAHIMQDALKLAALQSACALCDSALPEREGHPGLFHGLNAMFETLSSAIWPAAYVMWEIAFLRELGFSLDLSKCAGGGDVRDLAYVSPKTGRAVSAAAGQIYKERLLRLPGFLRPSPLIPLPEGRGKDAEQQGEGEDILTGLALTGYFLEHWAYAHHTSGIPEARLRFAARFAKYVGDSATGPSGNSLSNHVA